MDSVGGRLREARTRRQLTIADAEEATKIRARYLQALESEDWGQLPGEVYVRAFIRTYGAFLGLDGERLAEEQRAGSGAAHPGERLPRVDPRPRQVTRQRGRRRVSPALAAVGVSALLVVALVAIGLVGGSGGSEHGGTAAPVRREGRAEGPGRRAPRPAGHSLKLVATGEVWVCLEDGRGRPLVPGRTLLSGATAGPFRSGRFSLALGNGGLKMIVDGKRAALADSSGPVGYAIGSSGRVRELPEGERPTCT
jgi:cytoskeleton protein RodZ